MKLEFGKQNKSVASPINAKTIPLHLGGADGTIHWKRSVLQKQNKSLIHREHITSLCHNFPSNIWWTSNKIQRFAELVSFVLSTQGNTTWNKPDTCSTRLQVEMCQLLDPLRIRGPTEQHNLWQQSNTLWSQHWVMDSNGRCSTAQGWGLALLNKCEKCSHSHRKIQARRPSCVLSGWNTLGLLLPVHWFRNCTGSDYKW